MKSEVLTEPNTGPGTKVLYVYSTMKGCQHTHHVQNVDFIYRFIYAIFSQLSVAYQKLMFAFDVTGSSLADDLAYRVKTNQQMNEEELKLLLLQVADGLKYIHAQHLVHLDIKPGTVKDYSHT